MKNLMLINRRPHPGQFSIESIFSAISEQLQTIGWRVTLYKSPKFSRGVFPRVYNGIHLMFRQQDICHIVGDVTYLSFFLRRRSLIVTFHDLSVFERKSGIARYLIGLIWYHIPLRRARYVTAISEFTRSSLVKHFRLAEDRVQVIPNPLPPEFRFESKNPIDVRRRIEILQIGTKENKNLDRVIEALEALSPNYDLRLTIVGKLPDSELLTRVDKFEIENLHDLSLDEIVLLYQRSHLVMFASTYEGFGMPVIEGQAVGRPVITSNIEPMKSVSNGAAQLVDPLSVNEIAEAVEKLITEPELVEKLVTLGLENAQQYSIETIAAQYAGVYEMMT